MTTRTEICGRCRHFSGDAGDDGQCRRTHEAFPARKTTDFCGEFEEVLDPQRDHRLLDLPLHRVLPPNGTYALKIVCKAAKVDTLRQMAGKTAAQIDRYVSCLGMGNPVHGQGKTAQPPEVRNVAGGALDWAAILRLVGLRLKGDE